MGEVVGIRQPGWNGRGEPGDWLADNCGCEICRATRPDRTGPRVMTGPMPLLDESLVGLVLRAANMNHVHRTVTITRAVSEISHGHGNLAVRDDVDFAQLAWATKIAPHEIEARRYRPAAFTSELPGVDFHGAVVPLYDLRLNTRRLATSWLTGTPYHSALGHHRLATHCPVSGDILIDDCPRCGATLTWTTTNLLPCRSCGLDQRDRPTGRLSVETMSATHLMVSLIHPHPGRSAKAVQELPETLRRLNRGSIFELGWRLGCLSTGYGLKDRDSAWRLPLDHKVSILQAGSTALASWPVSLNSVITGRGSSGDDRAGADLVDDLRRLMRGRNVPDEMGAAVMAAAPGLPVSRAATMKSLVGQGANGGETARTLGVSQRIFERLAVARELKCVLDTGHVNRHRVIDMADLGPLADRIADRVSFGTLSQELGISRHGVEQLCCMGLLEAHDDSAMRAAFAERHVRRTGFDELVKKIDEAKLPWDGAGGCDTSISLRRAVLAIGGREKPWGPILLAMREGELPFRLRERTANGDLIDQVVLDESDLPLVERLSFDRPRYPDFAFEHRLKRQDVEELLNLKPVRFGEALAIGELERGSDRMYDLTTMLGLAEKMISQGEILARWSAHGRQLPAPFRGRKRLKRTSHLGWHRVDAEAAMDKHVPRPR